MSFWSKFEYQANFLYVATFVPSLTITACSYEKTSNMKFYLNFAAIRDFAGDEAAAYDRQVERQLGGPVRHHHLQPPAQTSARGRVSSARNGEARFFSAWS